MMVIAGAIPIAFHPAEQRCVYLRKADKNKEAIRTLSA